MTPVAHQIEQNHAELASQITHPVQEYDEARVARLVAQMCEAQRYTWPSSYVLNV